MKEATHTEAPEVVPTDALQLPEGTSFDQLIDATVKSVREGIVLNRKGDEGIRMIQEATVDLLLTVRIDGGFCFSVKRAREKSPAFVEAEAAMNAKLFPEIGPNVKGRNQKVLDQDADRARVASAVKQMVGNERVLESRVTKWAIKQLPAERQAELVEAGGDHFLYYKQRPTGAPAICQDPPEDLTAIVAAQCERDGLKLWATFGGSRGSGGGGRGSGQKQTPSEALTVVRTGTESGTYSLADSAEGLAELALALASRIVVETDPQKTTIQVPATVHNHISNALTYLMACDDYLTAYQAGTATAEDREQFTSTVAKSLSPEDLARLAELVGSPS